MAFYLSGVPCVTPSGTVALCHQGNTTAPCFVLCMAPFTRSKSTEVCDISTLWPYRRTGLVIPCLVISPGSEFPGIFLFIFYGYSVFDLVCLNLVWSKIPLYRPWPDLLTPKPLDARSWGAKPLNCHWFWNRCFLLITNPDLLCLCTRPLPVAPLSIGYYWRQTGYSTSKVHTPSRISD